MMRPYPNQQSIVFKLQIIKTPYFIQTFILGFIIMLPVIPLVLQTDQLITRPVGSSVAWSLLFFLFWNLWSFLQDVARQTARMHRIPCADCQFFTDNYHLKCPVHPDTALSELAINCPDFQKGR